MIEQDLQNIQTTLQTLANNANNCFFAVDAIKNETSGLKYSIENLTIAVNNLAKVVDELQSVIFTKKIIKTDEEKSNQSNESEKISS